MLSKCTVKLKKYRTPMQQLNEKIKATNIYIYINKSLNKILRRPMSLSEQRQSNDT